MQNNRDDRTKGMIEFTAMYIQQHEPQLPIDPGPKSLRKIIESYATYVAGHINPSPPIDSQNNTIISPPRESARNIDRSTIEIGTEYIKNKTEANRSREQDSVSESPKERRPEHTTFQGKLRKENDMRDDQIKGPGRVK